MILLLAGSPDVFKEGWGWLYKHWQIVSEHDAKGLSTSRNLKAFFYSDDILLRDKFAPHLNNLLWELQKSDENLRYVLKRSLKWELLRRVKNRYYEDRSNNLGFFSFLIKIFLFLKNYERTQK